MSRRDIAVAISLPDPYAEHLADWRRRLGDPLALVVPPHVTLLPPTAVRVEGLGGVEEHLRWVAAGEREFEITLRGSATFRPVSAVVFVPLIRGSADCERLERRVRAGPLLRSLRYPYHPHVTIAQEVPDDVLDRGFNGLARFEATFPVAGFSLFQRGSDGVWRPRTEFAFGRRVPQGAYG